MTIRFLGEKGSYRATEGAGSSVEVTEVAPRAWRVSYYGSTSRNPVIDGARSCMCPRVTLEQTFRTRKAAAEAGLRAQAAEQ